jgi:hypothetical protein
MATRRKMARGKSAGKKKTKAKAPAKKHAVKKATAKARKPAPKAKKPVAKKVTARKATAKAAKPAAKAAPSIHLPPLPPMTRHTFQWQGLDVLPSWAGLRFHSKWMKRSAKPSDGTVDVVVDKDSDDPSEPNASQLETYAYLKEHQGEIASTVLARILAEYPEQKQLYAESVDETWPVLPDVSDAAGLSAVIGPPTIHVWGSAQGGVGEIAFAFDCAWDEEHQLGLVWSDGEITAFGDGNEAGFIVE